MRSSRVCIVTNNPDAVYQRSVIAGFRDVAEQHGYQVSVQQHRKETDSLPDFRGIPGLLVIANALRDEHLRELYGMGQIISLVSHKIPDLPLPVVMSNNAQGIAELVQQLVEVRGRRKLVFLRGLPDQIDAQERELAFRREVVRHRLNVPENHYLRGDFTAEIAADSMRAVLAGAGDFDGVLASDYVMGIAAAAVLREAGIKVPEEVSVVGFGDGPAAEDFGLTAVAASITDLGRCAAHQLLSQIRGAHISGVTRLRVRLVVRET